MKFIIKDLLIIFELFFYIFRNFKYLKDKKFCLVTASDSNHYDYLINLIHNYEKKNNSNYFSNLIVFDIGMTNNQIDSLSKYNFLELRKFPFDEFPSFFKQRLNEHKNKIGGFAWKPAIINILKEDGFNNIVWLDSACLFNKNIFLFTNLILKNGFSSSYSTGVIKDWTHNSVLEKLNIDQDLSVINSRNLMAGVVGFSFEDKFAQDLLKNWLLLCLDKEMIFPKNSSVENHRHDQSLLSVCYWTAKQQNMISKPIIFGISIQNWHNKILYFFDEKNGFREKLLEEFNFFSTTTSWRSKIIVLFNANSLKKIPFKLLLTKTVVLFITDLKDEEKLRKHLLKKYLLKIYLNEEFFPEVNKFGYLKFKIECIEAIIKKEFEKFHYEYK